MLQSSGGTFTLLSDAERFQSALEGLCASLLNSYTIRYRCALLDVGNSSTELKLRIYRPGSFGEGVLDAATSVALAALPA